MTGGQALCTVALIAIATWFTRALPFMLFPNAERTPKTVHYLGRVLPYAIIGMLVVYCLKDVSLVSVPHGLPELLGILAVTGLYLWRRNTLLAIAGGTVVYMVLVQLDF